MHAIVPNTDNPLARTLLTLTLTLPSCIAPVWLVSHACSSSTRVARRAPSGSILRLGRESLSKSARQILKNLGEVEVMGQVLHTSVRQMKELRLRLLKAAASAATMQVKQ